MGVALILRRKDSTSHFHHETIYSGTCELGTPKGLWKTVLNSVVVLFLTSISMYWIFLWTEVTVLSSQVVPISQVVLKTGFTVYSLSPCGVKSLLVSRLGVYPHISISIGASGWVVFVVSPCGDGISILPDLILLLFRATHGGRCGDLHLSPAPATSPGTGIRRLQRGQGFIKSQAVDWLERLFFGWAWSLMIGRFELFFI